MSSRAARAKAWARAHLDMWSFGRRGRRHFRGDARYDLRNVTEGFRSRIDDQVDDAALIDRLCAAFQKAKRREAGAPAAFSDIPSWRGLRDGPLRPFSLALDTGNIPALQTMLRNFYRNPCSAGLLAPPHGMARAWFHGSIHDIYRRYYLSHVLSRYDYWQTLTHHRFTLKDLAGPGVGNPFGVVIDGTHIAVGSEYSHYCAHRVLELVPRGSTQRPVVLEVGGGFGAIAWYLLRDGPPATYVTCDRPERLALSAYYLLRSFPDRRIVLFGESDLSPASIARADVLFVPLFELGALPDRATDLAFSSLALLDPSPGTLRPLLKLIDRVVRRDLLFIEGQPAGDALAHFIAEDHPAFTLVDRRLSEWHTRGISGAGRRQSDGAAASGLVEQTFSRAAGHRMTPE